MREIDLFLKEILFSWEWIQKSMNPSIIRFDSWASESLKRKKIYRFAIYPRAHNLWNDIANADPLEFEAR